MCFNGGICEGNNGKMSCHCLAQYTGIKSWYTFKKAKNVTIIYSKGEFCENKWCEIQPSVCKNTGKCVETANGYSCNCTGKILKML